MYPIILFLFVYLPFILSQFIQPGPSDPNLVNKTQGKNDSALPAPVIDASNPVAVKNISSKHDNNVTHTTHHNYEGSTTTELEAGAVVRGVWVFVGISVLFIMYMAFQTYKKRNHRPVIVKKYGIKTRRTDVEMEPLPLDEDDDDETLFDLGSLRTHR
ncbi:unnamed protein product [Brassicogethes aeneus]|uniref:Uncharacterized protein n=1 Tax=Brassicogethes aeneus TaxID=1431903 RepID=A0A9P0AZU2_BRAAE|nr:unnamed protein product [Brassicogethes aeneus]